MVRCGDRANTLRQYTYPAGADSAWLTGVYAFELGMEKEGRERLIKASQNKEQYRDELALFLEVSESR